jgi:ceramide glucosyltransferase
MGYLGQLFTMPLPLALFLFFVKPGWWPVPVIAIVIRSLAAYTVSARVLKAPLNWLLLPVEDLAGFCFWLAGFFGNTVSWRGRRYRLYSDGRFQPIASSRSSE